MTDEQIIKAVDVCRNPDTCRGCPYHELYTAGCVAILMEDVFDLINRQKAEIERLKNRNAFLENEYKNQGELFWERVKIKQSEAIKEFAERVKEEINFPMAVWKVFDNLVKEMTEETE